MFSINVCGLRKEFYELKQTCIERRLEPLFERDNSGGRRFVAPRPANKLFNNDGERAQIKAWNDETVKTPNLFKVFFVGRDTHCVVE
ncbi:CLUMA_CG019711, isoform A [Clunio marinus]|uniref:CLUMA_CG019711, isoform A n=1 Tax=Clunio marinus TaxID=568069 RepID=A0A1J1J223_9DIPT|nr:CLUMA_CG019711, isoform A [Clunio marinus]